MSEKRGIDRLTLLNQFDKVCLPYNALRVDVPNHFFEHHIPCLKLWLPGKFRTLISPSIATVTMNPIKAPVNKVNVKP
jgi:hypothetical protein